MKFKHFIFFVLAATALLYFLAREKNPMREELKVEIKRLTNLKEIPNEYDKEIEFLKDSCSKKELIQLMKNKEPLIRAFSYLAILERKDINHFSILKANLGDTTKIIHWYFDDAANDPYLSDFYISMTGFMLTKNQKYILLDIILKKHNYLQNADWIIEDMPPNEKYYGLIKKLSKIKEDYCNQERRIYALSKFKKQEDVADIKIAMENSRCEFLTFKIIENWPLPDFYEILENHFKNNVDQKSQEVNDIEDYVYALACYKNKRSLEILEKLIQKETYPKVCYMDRNEEFVFKAIRYYFCPEYKALFEKLKMEVDPDIVNDTDLEFERLSARDLGMWNYL